MSPIVRKFLMDLPPPWMLPNFPLKRPGLAAWYDVSDLSSMLNNAGAVPANGEGVKLIADKSGNSNVNCLCLNGVAGNYASVPDSAALSITGDIDVRVRVAMNDWTPAGDQTLLAKRSGAGQVSWQFRVTGTSGVLCLAFSSDGTAVTVANSTVAPTISDFSELWVRATRASASGNIIFYTSSDGVNWTQLGTTVAAASGALFDSTAPVEVGSIGIGAVGNIAGRIYHSQIYNGIAGTLVFDANFTAAAKLATSFTESSSNAATVTINTSGATGARISGARDLVQMTAANQPILTIAATGNYLTFDGSNDYLKAAAFALSQPETVYFVGSQVTWTDQDSIYDGNSDTSGKLQQRTSSPSIRILASNPATSTSALAVGQNGVVSVVFNGIASSLRVNREAANTGDASTSAMGGFVLGSNGPASAQWSNITVSEIIIRSVADGTSTQDAFILYAMRKWGVQ